MSVNQSKIMKKAWKSIIVATLTLLMSRAIAVDCVQYAETVNRMLERKQPDAYLQAGTMFEYGSCVEQNWEKAGQYYQQAAQAGAKLAIPRLVALYAAKYRDPAAALWWAAQRPSTLPKACLPGWDPLKSPEAFLSELRAWPVEQLKACTYHAGLTSRLVIENEIRSAVLPVFGGFHSSYDANVEVFINVVEGTVEWYDVESKQTVISRVNSETLKPDLSSQPGDESKMSGLWREGVDALKEFGKPPSRELSWTKKNTFAVARRFSTPQPRIEIEVRQ